MTEWSKKWVFSRLNHYPKKYNSLICKFTLSFKTTTLTKTTHYTGYQQKLYNEVKIPIFGMGGIVSFKDIIEFIRVGSSMIQVGTLNYRDPSKINSLYDQLKLFLIKNKIDSISELIGKHNVI